MSGAWWEAVSSAGGKRLNEDLVRVIERGSENASTAAPTIDLLVLDGATSLVDDPEADGGNVDVVWFVARFADEFERALDAGVPPRALLAHAAEATAQAYWARTGGRELEPYAWPVASLAWLRVTRGAAGWTARLSSLGDCKALLRLPDGGVRDLDPLDNTPELTLYDEVAQLRAGGVLDPAARFERLLPLLRERRSAQNLDPHPVVLSARPQGPFAVREVALDVPDGALLLAMSDGFWRLVDPYAALTAEELAAACATEGLDAVLGRLRAYEAGAGGEATLAVKRADDATAVAWHAGPRVTRA